MFMSEKIVGIPKAFSERKLSTKYRYTYVIRFRDNWNKIKSFRINLHNQLPIEDIEGMTYKALSCLIDIIKITVVDNEAYKKAFSKFR